eukprot:3022889-Pyramimonas_sp.AAC.2
MEGEGQHEVLGDEQERARLPHRTPKPSQQEIEDHEAGGHASFRTWCADCVAGKRQANPHAATCEKLEIPEISFDYGCMGAVEVECAPMLIGRETEPGSWCGAAVPRK